MLGVLIVLKGRHSTNGMTNSETEVMCLEVWLQEEFC